MRILILLVLISSGCATVREPVAYKAGVQWLARAATGMASGQLREAEAAARTGDAIKCQALAHQALAVRILAPYQEVMQLWLGGAEGFADPGPPPPVPTAVVWCADRAAREESQL